MAYDNCYDFEYTKKLMNHSSGEEIYLNDFVEVTFTNGYMLTGFITQMSKKSITIETGIKYTYTGMETIKTFALLKDIANINQINVEDFYEEGDEEDINPNWKKYSAYMGDSKLYKENGDELDKEDSILVKATKNRLKSKYRKVVTLERIINYTEENNLWNNKPWDLAEKYYNDTIY